MTSYKLTGQVGIGTVVARLVGNDVPFTCHALGEGVARVSVADAHSQTLKRIIDVAAVLAAMRGEPFTRDEEK